MQYLSFCAWLISLSIMLLRFIHAVACIRIVLFFKGWMIFYWKDGPCFIYSFIDGHLCCLHLLTIVTNAALNTGVPRPVWIAAFHSCGCICPHTPRSGIARTAMAPYSSTLAWKIPWMEYSGRLQFMGSLRVGHDWVTSLWLFTFMHWRRKWQPTPVFLPRESQGWGSLVGCRLWGRTESDTTEAT